MNLLRPATSPARTLGEVAGFLGAPAAGESGILLTGLSLSSGAVVAGDLFVGTPGANFHGAAFAAAAMTAGARAVLTDDSGALMLDPSVPYLVVPAPRERLGSLAAWFYDHPARDLSLAGVTGTVGKTTVTWLIEAAMREAWGSAASLGTVASRIAGESIASARTTLEAPDLQAAFAAMREGGIPGCAMEISSHALAGHRVDGFTCDVAVLTNLGRDHLDFHGTAQAYHATKAELFTPAHARKGVIWDDGGATGRLAEAATIPVARVGPARQTSGTVGAGRVASAALDWTVARRGTVLLDGRPAQGFALIGPVTVEGSTRLVGSFNVTNAALALVTSICLGIDPEVAARGIAGVEAVPGRMDAVIPEAGPAPLAVVDFAHTPESVATALAALRERTEGRLIAVIGAGGARDPGKRSLMGEAAARLADVVIVTDDNPRDEDPAAIRAAILAGTEGTVGGPAGRPAQEPGPKVLEIADRAAAIRAAVEESGILDTVAVLGKGHETGQTAAGRTVAFDDKAVLFEAFREHGPWI
jgi:UDP-N-acetylmuramoyl-L-alanyl-D-glutamate--2,6-diaminopimelate ligase